MITNSTRLSGSAALLLVILTLGACGGGGSSRSNTPAPPPPPPEPNLADAAVSLSAGQVLARAAAAGGASASADLTINLDDGNISGTLDTGGLTATAVSLREGFAGQSGTEITALSENSATEWQLPDNTILSANQLQLLEDGGLHLTISTSEFPDGAVRGQILLGDRQVFVNPVSGDQEIPPVASNATAVSGLTYNPDDGSVIVYVQAENLENAVAGHVHLGFAGTNGPVVIELEQDAADANRWRSPAGAVLDAGQQDSLLAGELYINLHTPENPPGEIRCQILSDNLALTLVSLSGAAEVPAVATAASGSAGLTLNTDTAELQLHITTFGLDDAVAAHVHTGFAGTNGPVDIELEQDPDNPAHWLAAAGTMLTAEQQDRLDSGAWYLNVHTPANPPGEVRGQIAPAGITVIIAELDGNQEVPPLTTSASGNAGLTLNDNTGGVEVHITASGVDDAVAAHVHAGFAGANGPVVVDLEQDANDVSHWLAPAGTVLDEDQLSSLNNGELYLNVHTPAIPAGEIRGQLIPDGVTLLFTPMTGNQSVPPVTSAGSALGAVTLNLQSLAIVATINASGLDDAVAAHVHSGLAGNTGPVEIDLIQDPTDVSRWSSAPDAVLSGAQYDLFSRGALYLNLHTPANPPGEVRGQIVPEGIEVALTALSPGDVVPPAAGSGSGIAASTITAATHTLTTHVNLAGLNDADTVSVHQAPAMQNGPLLFNFTQDTTNPAHWMLLDQALDSAVYAALRNRGLYVQAATPGEPGGAVRGQIEPAMSSPAAGGTFMVSSIAPADGSTGTAPDALTLVFNRNVLADSVDADQFALLASGGDADFSNGNETAVALPAAALSGMEISFDLSAAPLAADTYQFTLDNTPPLSDPSGAVLDGDGDGNPGGIFTATFAVEAAAPAAPTLTEIQNEIFSVSCASSGCHGGATPAQGMNLSAGQAFSNIVGVASLQAPALNRVQPGDPDNSYLVQKVEGTAAGGARMPLGQPALSNELIQKLRGWIADGAQDN